MMVMTVVQNINFARAYLFSNCGRCEFTIVLMDHTVAWSYGDGVKQCDYLILRCQAM